MKVKLGYVDDNGNFRVRESFVVKDKVKQRKYRMLASKSDSVRVEE